MTETIPSSTREDFPVVWESPEDEKLWWTRDRMHRPGQASAFAVSWERDVFQPGFLAAGEALSLPIAGWASRWINTYLYTCLLPATGTPEELEARGKRAEEAFMAAILRLGESWEGEYLPEILEHVAFWDAFDLEGASVADLTTHLEETISRGRRLWDIHFRIVHPSYVAISEFEEFYAELFGEGGADAYRLLQGLPNKTMEMGQALWALSRAAASDPDVRGVILTRDPRQALPALEESEPGRAFLSELDSFLEAYGERGELWGLESVSWIEDPAPVMRTLADLVPKGDEHDPAAETARLAAERERAVAEARARLEDHPPEVRGRFEAMLEAAQTGNVLTEDHGFYIDFMAHHKVRRVLLEVGRRLVEAEVVTRVDDLFMLTIDELLETLHALPSVDRHGLVAERRAEMERFADADPPVGLGTPPTDPPPDNPLVRSIGKLFGGPPPAAPEGEGILSGHPGSGGVVRGTARIVRSLAESDQLEPGDVLVAETTAPPWTPLFAVAAAVVTDTGGTLSHCAIVAREYGIPAVVGTENGTRVIRDGQTVEVDGDRGLVRVVD